MAETYGFYDTEELVDGTYDREYIAQQWADYFKLFIGTGVFASPTNQLKVVAGEGMNIIIKEGWAFIEGRWYHNDADLVLPVQPNTTVSTITSGVFIQADSANREIKAVIATGRTTPDRESPYYELELAQIQLETGATAITDAMITDMRTDESVCGFVKGLLEGVIPTADLFLQFETQFMDWFDSMKDQLSEDAAGHLQQEIDELQPVRKRTITNLLNPTANTTTVNGITFTNNGDGTYTLSGTASPDARLTIQLPSGINVTNGQTVKLVGCPSDGSESKYQLYTQTVNNHDYGNGVVFDWDSGISGIAIIVKSGVTVTDLTFKPMLTTDLYASYDEFVQYSGDGELNENVAELKKEVEENTSDITQINNELTSKADKSELTSKFKYIYAAGNNSVNLDSTTDNIIAWVNLYGTLNFTPPSLITSGHGVLISASGLKQILFVEYNGKLLEFYRQRDSTSAIWSAWLNNSVLLKEINYSNLLASYTSAGTHTYTATQDCYIGGSYGAQNTDTVSGLYIDGQPVYAGVYRTNANAYDTNVTIPYTRLRTGQVAQITLANPNTRMYVYGARDIQS